MGHWPDGSAPEPVAGEAAAPGDLAGIGLGFGDGGVIDVSRLSLRQVFGSDDSTLGHAMRRLLADLEGPDISSAFSSFASP